MKKKQFSFGNDYLTYFKDVSQGVDKATKKIPDLDIFDNLLQILKIEKNDKVLDCGCSFGRLFPIISKYSDLIYGIDVELPVIDSATNYSYISLNVGSAEVSNLPTEYFDKTIMFGVFDITDQKKALIEQNRILSIGGQILITGKNDYYHEDDKVALIAERNAHLKNFPNHFTDTKLLVDHIGEFGYKVNDCLLFERRGDFADYRFSRDLDGTERFYEYCLFLEKISEPNQTNVEVCDGNSRTAKDLAKQNGFTTVDQYFNSGETFFSIDQNHS